MDAAELIRRYNAGERDFRGADLGRAKLREADLSGADLSEADLVGANVREVLNLHFQPWREAIAHHGGGRR